MRTLEVQAIQDVTIMAMASLAETRDNETGNHIRRTQLYVKALAERLRHAPALRGRCSADRHDRAAVQVGAAARHRQDRHSRSASCSSPAR